jgi:hypothetical protein
MQKPLFIITMILGLAACASPIRNLTHQQLIDGKQTFSNRYESDLESMSSKSIHRIRDEYFQEEEQVYDILVLSGGGALGAFGAGFLKGWGTVTEAGYERPDFDSVSGISTGALIAPFAFVGTDASYQKIVDIYRTPDEEMVIARPILSFLSGKQSYFKADVLHQRIRQSIDQSMVNDLAQKHLQNKTLIIGATNLDYGVMRVWDLSRIASTKSANEAQPDITQKLIASSAIPSAFPPVEIEKHLYVDGGASMQIVSGIDNRQWLYNNDTPGIDFVRPERPIKLRLWIIINNKLVMDPSVVRNAWSSIATRSLVSLMRGSTLQTIQDIETFSQMINQRNEFDVQMHFVAIPQDYGITYSRNLFDSELMQSLVDLGETMGADSASWKTQALRPGASILDIR